ncbi:hypothetical protein [Telluribacter sp. SYSU D00476]|uniref:hypothetical protein n=1 Tax=Telluribacter sp. SYSU D00476 TaxID=2811430 RepID=UPI001FF60766|nr:hypothetical protein [Telluribacter sp. SYSU D00476]
MFRYIVLVVFILTAFTAQSQNLDSLSSARNERDSIRYTRLKERMGKTRLSRHLYRLLFRDVYNRGRVGEVSTIETNPFIPFEGLIIGSISIQQLDIFGESVYDTTRRGNRLERFVSKHLHTDTRKHIIRNSFLLFNEGDLINAQQLKDNERLLRSNPTILDARILVTRRAESTWLADVVVLVQDVWSLNVSGGFAGFDRFNLGVDNINVGGYAHSHYNAIRWNARDTLQRLQFRSIYTIPYIGKTFITGQASFIWERDLKQQSIRLSRPFLTVQTKYAGSLNLGHARIQEYKRPLEDRNSIISYPVAYNYFDVWIGRSFKLPGISSQENTRFIVALRTNNYNHTQRPAVRADTNKLYWNRHATLASVGFSNRNYRRDVLIYGFGRTEDVPLGHLFALTVGREGTEFGQRGYGGVQYATGNYLPHGLGYLYGMVNIGSYFQGGKAQQGVLGGQLNYFSGLAPLGNSYFRQFINIRYTYGINRDPLEYLNISRNEGIRGVSSVYLLGTKRLTAGLESVLFSTRSLLGFRIAYFLFGDLGLVESNRSLWKSPVYQGYGIGFRFRNENITFNTFQVRVGYYPNIPDVYTPWRFEGGGISTLQLRDFDIAAPSILPLR